MSREIVLDIETQNTFQDIGSTEHSKLRISLVGVYFYETDTYEYFLEPDLPKLWPRLEQCERVVGYNTKGFDNLVMASYYTGSFERIPQLDLLEEIAKVLGFRVKLDDVAKATIGSGKTGHGLQAVEFWRQGKIKELAEYCLMDVKVTKLVYEYARLHGQVKCEDRSGKMLTIPLLIPSPPAQKPTVNLSLGL